MAKKTEIDCPLRQLREITGKTQAAFAKILGCSLSTLKKIEQGDNSKLNLALLNAAFSVFGVSLESLVPPSTGPTCLIEGTPYTKEIFEAWWNVSVEQKQALGIHLQTRLIVELELVLAASWRLPGMVGLGVMGSLVVWVKDVMHNFQLLPHYETEWNERVKKMQTGKFQLDREQYVSFCWDKYKLLQKTLAELSGLQQSLWGRAELKGKKYYTQEKELFAQFAPDFAGASPLKLRARLFDRAAREGLKNPALLFAPAKTASAAPPPQGNPRV
ncbi:MAG: helix-turn-helix transcriptional regulator [Verrucomicrobiia bacterium]